MLSSRGRGGAEPLLGAAPSKGPAMPRRPAFRLKMHHLVGTLVFISLSLFYFTSEPADKPTSTTTRVAPPVRSAKKTILNYCPFSTARKHIPTVALVGDQAQDPADNRTYWVRDNDDPDLPATFLPHAYPPRDMRFAQNLSGKEEKVPPGQGRLHEGVQDEQGERLCPVYTVPSSPRPHTPLMSGWRDSKVMFGMSTPPDRVLWNLPVWSQWLPKSSNAPLDTSDPAATSELPLVLVLMPEPNPTEAARSREAVEEASTLGMYVEMRPREADRFETRYFALAEEMWIEAERREQKEGVRTEWFIFACVRVLFMSKNLTSRADGLPECAAATTTRSTLTLHP